MAERRSPKPKVGGSTPSTPAMRIILETYITMAKFKPIKYVQEVKTEIDKVTWPSRRETTVTSIMVLIFVFIAAIFFLLSDQLLSWVVSIILSIGG